LIEAGKDLLAKHSIFQPLKAVFLRLFGNRWHQWHQRCNFNEFSTGTKFSKAKESLEPSLSRPKRTATMDMKTNKPAAKSTNTQQLPIDLNDLLSAVASLPEEHRKTLQQPLKRVVEYTKRRRRILNLIQEALSQLRMDMKYLMFDLEATRRERDAYKDGFESDF